MNMSSIFMSQLSVFFFFFNKTHYFVFSTFKVFDWQVTSDRMQGNGLKLHQWMFR